MSNDVLTVNKPKRDEEKSGGLSAGSIMLIVGIMAVAAVFGIQLAQQNQTQPFEGLAPDFRFTTFDGEEHRLSDFRGQVVVLNFWASWCAPCRVEAPDLQDTWEAYADTDEVVFLGIAYADNGPKSLEFMDEFGITYINAPDLGTRISELYNIEGVPETFIIDKDGNVAEFIYAGVTYDQLTTSIDSILEGETS
jgi:cytochrome c biogenesis protein CcmG/thiol:disulfide interchange protein DsbE